MWSSSSLLIFLWALPLRTLGTSLTKPLPRVEICSKKQFFDSTSLSCRDCANATNHKTPNQTAVDVYGNFLGCICETGYVEVKKDCSQDSSGNCWDFVCEACSNGTSFSDRSACTSCEGVGVANGECQCPSLILEADASGNKLSAKECGDCPMGMGVIPFSQYVAGVYYERDLYSCQSCPDELMTMSVTSSGAASCNCPSGYTKVGQPSIGSQSCVKATNEYLSTATAAATIRFGSATVISAVILHYYTLAATRCKYSGGPDDRAHCQILANLCVLQQYNALSYPCIVLQEISTLRPSIGGISTWPQGLPWIYYRTPSTPCKDTSLQMTMSLNSMQLEFLVATYTLNGTFLGYSDVETLFSYCPMASPWTQTGGGTSSTTHWMIFGSSQYITFKCNPGLLVGRPQLFHELFLKDTSTGLLMPISVRITNLLDSSGGRPNSQFTFRDLCKSNEIHVRRFYLFDISTGITETSPDAPVALRFAEYIRLDIRITENDPESIYTPVLTLQFKDTKIDSTTETSEAQAPSTSYDAASTPSVTLEVIYSMNTKTFFSTLNGFFIAGIVVAIIVFLSKYFNWRTRNLRTAIGPSAMAANSITLTLLIQLTSLACHSWVLVFFPFLVLVSWYWFVFFKLQDTVAVMLPPMHSIYSPESDYNSFVVLLHLLFFCQLFHIAYLIYRQASVDLFFIDWEPVKKENKSVSIWRTILVANEWNEMQVIRRTDLSLTLFALGFFLLGLKLENNATQQPELSNLQEGRLNILLRFANTTWFWLVMTTAQLLWKYIIYERYITEPKEQIFIDMCTIAKVSVIVLDEPYHGYYLHCRSPHQYADGNMAELVSMLHKEEVGLTVDRTLDGANSDAQCYEIFLTGDWRLRFEKASGGLMDYDPITNILESVMSVTQPRRRPVQSGVGGDRGGGSWSQSRNGMSTDRMMKCWTDLNSFLQAFIENNFSMPDLKRVFREQTYLEKAFGTPPDLMAPGQSCVFYPDENYSYVKVHLLGREVDLIIFDILVYSIFDLWLGSTAVSMLLCYLVDSFISRLREELGQNMIAKKTLVDERFLN